VSVSSSVLAFASQKMPKFSSRFLASSGYTLLPESIGDESMYSVWHRSTAERQDRAWQPIVAAAKAGRPREDVAALFDALEALPARPSTILEVGCGGGYNSELIASRYPDIEYAGVDISAAMIEIAREHYPTRRFEIGSAYDLGFRDRSVDVVLDGVALLHMPGWRLALGEYARVARGRVILHGLTLTDKAPTTRFAKYAYGQPALEFVFNRTELLAECASVGLELDGVQGGLDYDLRDFIGIDSVSETWTMARADSI
jgi:ubiquinone/menaquinone biosynthesis C-methylase UbiE